TLDQVTSEFDDHDCLFFGLDALRDHLDPFVVCKLDDSFDETGLAARRVNVADHRHIDLDEVRSEQGNRIETRIAGSEIVDRKAMSRLSQVSCIFAKPSEIGYRRSFRDFKYQTMTVLVAR